MSPRFRCRSGPVARNSHGASGDVRPGLWNPAGRLFRPFAGRPARTGKKKGVRLPLNALRVA